MIKLPITDQDHFTFSEIPFHYKYSLFLDSIITLSSFLVQLLPLRSLRLFGHLDGWHILNFTLLLTGVLFSITWIQWISKKNKTINSLLSHCSTAPWYIQYTLSGKLEWAWLYHHYGVVLSIRSHHTNFLLCFGFGIAYPI